MTAARKNAPGGWRLRLDRMASHSSMVITLLPVLLTGVILVSLVLRALPLLETGSVVALLTGRTWSPQRGLFGFLPFISGTLWVTLGAVSLAVPPCLLTALYLAEYARSAIRQVVKPMLDLLAAIPSVVYGVWGMLVIVPWVGTSLGPRLSTWFPRLHLFQITNPTGFSILAGSLVLAVMIAPFIIAVTFEVLMTTSEGARQACLALGATRWQTIRSSILPVALPGIFAGVVLGASRALGETMAVLMVVGNVARLPTSIFDPAYPLPALIANHYGEMMSIPLYDSALMGAALLLLLIVMLFNIASTLILRRIMGRVRRAW